MLKSTKLSSVLFVSLMLSVLILNSFINNKGDEVEETVIDSMPEPIEFRDTVEAIEELIHGDSLKVYLKSINVKHPDIVYAQAVLESGYFTSTLFHNNSNLFGMKAAKQRPYTYIDVKSGYAYYSDWKQSVLDYALFQSAYMRGLNREQYFRYLQRNYADDSGYVRKLQAIIDDEDFENLN